MRLIWLVGLALACRPPAASPTGDARGASDPAPGATAPVTSPATQASPRVVDVAALAAARATAAPPPVLDVRTAEEFAEGHVPGAVNIPVDALASRLGELDSLRGGPVYVICRSGKRSAVAASLLSASGFDAIDVAGGTLAWTAAGHAVE